MASDKTSGSLTETIWRFFASIQLTIVLLLSLAATSILGTLIPQNAQQQDYLKAFGDFFYRLFYALDLFDMYHSWWFQLLLLLLVINIIVCSIDRLMSSRKILFVRRPKFSVNRFRNAKAERQLDVAAPPTTLKEAYRDYWQRKFTRFQHSETENGFFLFGESGRWTRFGVYIVHLSVVVLLLGGMIGSIFGFEGYVNLAPGDSAQRIRLRNSNQSLTLDFAIRCDDFTVRFYDSGAPQEFRSSLAIVENGQTVVEKDIIVNDPLRYKGISIYQASYGPLPPKGAKLSFTSKATGMIYQREAVIGKPVSLPEGLGSFTLKSFNNSATFRQTPVGQAFIGTLTSDDGQPREILLPVRFPSFDKMRGGEVMIAVKDPLLNYYTGLQISRDPGVWVVYTGFILMILGCYVTFFMSHRQYCLEVVGGDAKTRVRISAVANKSKLALPSRVEVMASQLAKLHPEDDDQ